MKIGILTFHRPCNFGANLQAYSSSHYFMAQGHQVSIINYLRDADINYSEKVPLEQFKAHQKFVDVSLPITEEVRTPEQLRKLVLKYQYDVIVIGADAVWRSPNDDDIFFAKWLFEDKSLSSVSVISMAAAHMGNGYSKLTKEHREAIRDSLSKFKYVTVRDRWTADVINRDIFNGEKYVNTIIPDPVFMLDRLVDVQWVSNGQKSKQYFVMTLPLMWGKGRLFGSLRYRWFAKFKRIAHKHGYSLVELPLPEGKSGMPFDYSVPYPIDPLQWYLWIKNAKAFLGLRFHATVSSISSGTPFYSLDTYGASNSLRNYILSLCGLKKNILEEDKKSKIFNLLNGSGFESYRVSQFLETTNPKKVFEKLNHFDIEKLSLFREKRQRIFESAMAEGLELSEKNDRKITKLKSQCTGCFACMNACPVNAITLPENREGFYFPRINYSVCINCGQCDSICPVLNVTQLQTAKRTWYGWAKDDVLRKSSSSGGVFGLLANGIIQQGGVVYGAAFNYGSCIRLEHRSSEDIGLEPLLKSKYVQSYVGDTFSNIKKDLEDGRKVMFCGTPCQADGLRHFLKKDYQNLLVADFVCHGVPSMAMLREHLSMLRINNVESLDYRPKNRNWVDDIVIKYNGGKVYQNYWINDAYFRCFEKAESLRRSCYNCAYCNGSRASDITLADFWGYKEFDPSIYDAKGISLVMANTEEGIIVLENLSCQDNCSLISIDTKYSEYAFRRLRNGENGYDIEKRNVFFKDVNDLGYKTAIDKHFPIPKQTFFSRIRGKVSKIIKRIK